MTELRRKMLEEVSVRDFIRTAAPPPGWLENAGRGGNRSWLTSADIDAGIAAYRREKKRSRRHEAK